MRDLNGVETGFDDPRVALKAQVIGDLDERVERDLRRLFDGTALLQMKHLLRTGLYQAVYDEDRRTTLFSVTEENAALLRAAGFGDGT